MKIAIGSDHGGYIAKEALKQHLVQAGYEIVDVGSDSLESCNYAEYGLKAAKLVSNGDCKFGILICSSGEGISIAANKVHRIRCGIGYNDEVAMLIRQHNDCNMIAFGAKFMSIEDIIRRTDIFLSTDFEAGRHVLRVNTIKNFENN
jgi:ribose 5-phosphate isomerase B